MESSFLLLGASPTCGTGKLSLEWSSSWCRQPGEGEAQEWMKAATVVWPSAYLDMGGGGLRHSTSCFSAIGGPSCLSSQLSLDPAQWHLFKQCLSILMFICKYHSLSLKSNPIPKSPDVVKFSMAVLQCKGQRTTPCGRLPLLGLLLLPVQPRQLLA